MISTNSTAEQSTVGNEIVLEARRNFEIAISKSTILADKYKRQKREYEDQENEMKILRLQLEEHDLGRIELVKVIKRGSIQLKKLKQVLDELGRLGEGNQIGLIQKILQEIDKKDKGLVLNAQKVEEFEQWIIEKHQVYDNFEKYYKRRRQEVDEEEKENEQTLHELETLQNDLCSLFGGKHGDLT